MARLLIGIVGAGNLGTALAYTAAYNAKAIVKLIDVSEENLACSYKCLERWLDLERDRRVRTINEKYDILSRILVSPSLEDLENTDFVFECVNEDVILKNQVVRSIEKYVNKDIVIATSAKTIPITKISHNTISPERVLGMQFMHFPLDSYAVEIIPSFLTSDKAVSKAQ